MPWEPRTRRHTRARDHPRSRTVTPPERVEVFYTRLGGFGGRGGGGGGGGRWQGRRGFGRGAAACRLGARCGWRWHGRPGERVTRLVGRGRAWQHAKRLERRRNCQSEKTRRTRSLFPIARARAPAFPAHAQTMATAGGRISAGLGASLIGQHASERNPVSETAEGQEEVDAGGRWRRRAVASVWKRARMRGAHARTVASRAAMGAARIPTHAHVRGKGMRRARRVHGARPHRERPRRPRSLSRPLSLSSSPNLFISLITHTPAPPRPPPPSPTGMHRLCRQPGRRHQ